MAKNYTLVLGSPVNYNELVIYLRIEDEEIALIQKEDGPEKIKIEFFENIKSKVSLDDFMEALAEAKKELLK